MSNQQTFGSTKELDAAVAPILQFLEDNQGIIAEPTYVFLETAFMWLKRDVELARTNRM